MKMNRKSIAKKSMLTVLCVILVLSFAGCGGGGGNSGNAGSNTPTYNADFDPYYLHPGLAEGSSYTSSDVWYPVDSPESLPMYFTYGYDKGYDDSLFVITWIDEEGYDYVDCLTEVSGKHLVSMSGEELEVDFVFPDAFTAYDKETKTLYTRDLGMSYDDMLYEISDVTFEREDYRNSFTFCDDGTAIQEYDGTEYTGTWMLTSPTVLTFFDDTSSDYDVSMQLLQDNQGVYLYSDSYYYYPYEAEDAAA